MTNFITKKKEVALWQNKNSKLKSDTRFTGE